MSKSDELYANTSAQLVYLDFDGELTQYNNAMLGIDLDVEMLDSRMTAAQQQTIIAALNEKYAGQNVQFTLTKPVDEENYSTVFVGRSDDFVKLGNFAGLAETIDKGNKIKNDDAFVFVDAKQSVDAVISVIDHEVGHLLGEEHDVQTGTINDYAATKWEVENNDSKGLADYAGYVYYGDATLYLKGYSSDYYDFDWFKINAGSSGTLRFYEYNSNYNYRLTLYNSSGTQLYTTSQVGPNFSYYVTAGNTYYVRIDPMVNRTSYSNNYSVGVYYSSSSGSSSYGSPDLRVSSYTLSKSSINSNESVTLTFDIDNLGTGSSGSSYAYIYDGNTYLGSVYVPSLSSYLSTGWYKTCTYTISAGRLSAGTHSIYVVADGSSAVSESNESNNQSYKTLTVSQNRADLGVSRYTVSKTSINTNESVTLTFDIDNYGSGSSVGSYAYIYDGNTLLGSVYVPSLSSYLTTGWYKTCTYTISAGRLSAGTHNLYVVADGTRTNTESNESNNQAYRTITVSRAKADLKILDYTVTSTSITTGGSVKLSFKYANSGNAASGTTVLKVYSGNTLLKSYTMGSVSGGYYRSCSVTLSGAEIGTGSKKIYLVADANNQVSESNESNNQAYRTINVTQGKADLRFVDYTVSASSIASNGSVKLSFKYANSGAVAAGATVLKVYKGNTLLKSYSMGSVAAGSYRNCSVTLNASQLSAGANKIYLVADANGQVSESNESNNKAYRTVTVAQGKADLNFSAFTLSSSAISSNASVRLNYTLVNKGSSNAGASVLKVYSGNRYIKSVSIAALTAGATRAGSITLTAADIGMGTQRISVVADANNQISESNEGNNQAYRTLTVQPALWAANDPSDWLLGSTADINGDGFDDMLLTNSDCDLAEFEGAAASRFADLADALGSGWNFGGVADWNNDGRCEILFCGSDESIMPEVDADSKLKLLA